MRRLFIGLTVAAGVVLAATLPASAQISSPAASTTDTAAAGDFIAALSDRVFAVLKTGESKTALKARFRTMLKENFAVDEAGLRLIRRYRSQITPAQLSAYHAVLPDYVVNVYTDRLINYSNATVKIVRTQAHGASGNVDVFSRISVPGKEPFEMIWLVEKGAGGKWLIGNVTVSGVNLSITQEADFSSFIARNGFDALIAMMKSANAKSA